MHVGLKPVNNAELGKFAEMGAAPHGTVRAVSKLLAAAAKFWDESV